MNGVGFEILARTPVPKLPLSYPPPPPPPAPPPEDFCDFFLNFLSKKIFLLFFAEFVLIFHNDFVKISE